MDSITAASPAPRAGADPVSSTGIAGAALHLAGRYLALLLGANLAWEIAQLPLYTLWGEGSPAEIAVAVLHCTLGDVAIGAAALAAAVVLTRAWRWPGAGFGRVAVAATAFGAAATIALEWLNVEVRGAWAYAAAMPRIPPLGTGLTPVLQWLVLPPLCLAAARRLAQPPPQAQGRHP
jgi:hypothetical protein